MYFTGNPFEKRATEYLKDGPAFLSIVSPEPLSTFFEEPAARGILFDRLVTIVGAPGSGKTTLAKLFQFDNLSEIIRDGNTDHYRPLFDAMSRCKVITSENRPTIVGCRLPMESEYRDFWELPYREEVKSGLMTSLLQARAVIAWLRMIRFSGFDLNELTVRAKDNATAALAQIGGSSLPDILERAKAVELAIYRISSALLPPPEDRLPELATQPYYPFSVLSSFIFPAADGAFEAVPLAVMDDAHILHADQLSKLQAWLARREMPIARWLQMRFDALSESAALLGPELPSDSPSGTLPSHVSRLREITDIRMQPDQRRGSRRLNFRKMSRDMANRYLRLMPVFARRQLRDLGALLSVEPKGLTPSQVAELHTDNETFAREYRLAAERVQEFRARIIEEAGSEQDDVREAMLGILLRRYVTRIPQTSFLDSDDVEPSRPLAVDTSLVDAAKIQLLNKFGRPYYYGLEMIADASSENAEQFLTLAAPIVANLETLLIRNERIAALSTQQQHNILVRTAKERISKWDFPECRRVRVLVEFIGHVCKRRTVEATAPLGAGANAIGVLENDFAELTVKYPELARILKYAVAYNALSLKRYQVTKDRSWCLIELSGILCVHHGLTLKRGGFVDTVSLRELAKMSSDV